MKIVFFGTPSFAAEILAFLLENQIEILAVVTKPDKPRGRSGKPAFSAVKQLVTEKYPLLPLYQPDQASHAAFAEKLKLYGADLFVVIAYGEIIKQNLLEMPRLGCINLHASLLPKYRGAAPIHFALLNGDKESGVTVMEMVQKMDAGDILAQAKVPIPASMNFEELESKLCTLGAQTLLDVIHQYEKKVISKTPQDSQKATYVTKIDPSFAQIDWHQAAEQLHNRVRAFSPRPGAWCPVEIGGQTKRLKIFRSEVQKDYLGKPGETLVYQKDEWVVACGKGALKLLQVQLEGKKQLSSEDFIRGISTPPTF